MWRVLNHYRRTGLSRSALLAALSLCCLVAIYGVAQSAPVHIKIEAESGTNVGDTRTISDVAASGGSALSFTTTPNDPYADVPSNFNVNDWLITASIPEDNSWEPTGNFRFLCTFSHLGYMDPIVYPGQADKGHLHMFFGNKSTDQNSTYQSLRSSGDGSCPGGPLNRTGYWMPAVFDANDSNKIAIPDYFNIYYKGGFTCSGTLSQKQECIRNIHDLPNGLRIIAGYDMNGPADQDQHHEWYCGGGTKMATIPNSCNDELIVAIHFPTCWDGVNLDSTNHRSHMAYAPRNPDTGQLYCPSTHPVMLPDLTEFAGWYNPGNTSGWSLSSDHMSGMTHADGSTMHADWFGAWDNNIKSAWMDNCVRGMRNANSGNLCNGKQLKPIQVYGGPMKVSGYTDFYR